MSKLRWGVIGAGKHFFLRVYPGVSTSQIVEIPAVASRDKARAESLQAEYGFQRVYSSYDDLLGDPDVQAVFLGLPNHLHAEWIRRAAEAGKHVLCEKPLGMSADEVRQSFDAAERHGVLLMEAFMYRFHEQWLHAYEVIRSGEIGEIRTIQADFGVAIEEPGNIRNRKETGGGALRDLGCYAVSMARLLLRQEPRRVVAFTTSLAQSDVDDLSSALLDFNTAHAALTVGTKSHYVQNLVVVGTGGRIEFELPIAALRDAPVRLEISTRQGTRVVPFAPQDQWTREVEHFSQCILDGSPPLISREESVQNQTVIDALFASAASAQWTTP
jgi:predicted dehydrogenase